MRDENAVESSFDEIKEIAGLWEVMIKQMDKGQFTEDHDIASTVTIIENDMERVFEAIKKIRKNIEWDNVP